MSSNEIRKKFLDFFAARGHKAVPSSSLIPDDPSVLLTTAGMQQFKKYYTGEADPLKDFGTKNTASIQKSFRTSDIDQVGDESHLTFFEMLGNFSFGGYFKKDAIRYAFEFFKELNIPIDYVTVFGGDKRVPADAESENIWHALGITRIRRRGRDDNFWGPTGKEGPCGPTTEIYVNNLEIWNIVFNEYYCAANETLSKLKTPGVDTGMGLERLAMVLQEKSNIFETDLFAPYLELLPPELDIRKKRIVVDHLRGAAFLIADSVRPSNKEAGYILRRLIRRVVAYTGFDASEGLKLFKNSQPIPRSFQIHTISALMHEIVHDYGEFYPELLKNSAKIQEVLETEIKKFLETMRRGLAELWKIIKTNDINSETAFNLYQTYGLPYETIKDFAKEKAKNLTRESFDAEFKKHQEISRAGLERKFGGHGLILDTGELKAANPEELARVTRLHTATHLLNAALRKVLGPNIQQQGSDITAERTRFDFTFPRKLTPEEIHKLEELVNYAIQKDFPVTFKEMDLTAAKKSGALFFFKGKYPPRVKVYTVGDGEETFSKELCGGPHVTHTGEVGKFTIIKEEASSAGIRRIRAVVAQ